MQDPRRRAAVGLWVGGSDGIGTREPWAAGGRNQSGGNGRERNGRHACDRRVPGDSPVDGASLPRGGGGVLADPLIRLGAGLGRRRPPPLSGRDEDGVRGDGGRGGGRRRWRRRRLLLPLRSLHVRGLRPPSSSMNGGGAARTRLCRGAGGESDWRRGGGGGGGGRGFYRAVAVGGFCVAPLCQLPLLLRGACCFPSRPSGPAPPLCSCSLALLVLAWHLAISVPPTPTWHAAVRRQGTGGRTRTRLHLPATCEG